MRKLMRLMAVALLAALCVAGPLGAQEPGTGKYSAFIGAGFETEGKTNPGGAAGLITVLGENVYSFTGLRVSGVSESQPITSAVQGLLYKFHDSQKLDIYAKGDGGITQSAEATSGDFSGGGVITYKLTEHIDLFLGLAARVAPAAGGISPSVLVGLHLGR